MDVGTTEPLATENVPPSASSGAGTADWGGTESDDDCGDTQPRVLGKNAKAAMKSTRLYLMQTSCTDSVAESFRVFAGELEKHMECQKKQSTITSFFWKRTSENLHGMWWYETWWATQSRQWTEKPPNGHGGRQRTQLQFWRTHWWRWSLFFRCAQAVQLKKTPFCQTTLKKTSKKILKSIVRMTHFYPTTFKKISKTTLKGIVRIIVCTQEAQNTLKEQVLKMRIHVMSKDLNCSDISNIKLNGARFDKILCTSALYSDVVSKYKITVNAHFFEASQV